MGAYLTASLPGNEVGVVEFDTAATIHSQAVAVGANRAVLTAAINSIDADGGTDLGAGLSAGCDVLTAAHAPRRAAIILTDGDGDYVDEASCFARQGWPVFTIGLSDSVDDVLLQQIATQTGGRYLKLDSTTNLVCEFQQIRAQIAGFATSPCAPTETIEPGQTISFNQNVGAAAKQVTFTDSWPGSTIQMTVVSPSGRSIDGTTTAADVVVSAGATFETVSVNSPEAGTWQVKLFGAVVSPGGEPSSYSTVELQDESIVFAPLAAPVRVLDTRGAPDGATADGQHVNVGPIPAGTTYVLPINGRAAVPANAGSAALNVTAVSPTGPGCLTIFPCGQPRPNASNVNYVTGQIVPNAIISKIGDNGSICIFTYATTNVIVDVAGTFPDDRRGAASAPPVCRPPTEGACTLWEDASAGAG